MEGYSSLCTSEPIAHGFMVYFLKFLSLLNSLVERTLTEGRKEEKEYGSLELKPHSSASLYLIQGLISQIFTRADATSSKHPTQ